MGTISIREHIRWIPDPESEPTSTIVLTSPGHRFVDLRILRPENHQGPWTGQDEPLSLDRLDWAIAGTTSSTKVQDTDDVLVSRSTFTHWISSRMTNPEGFSDEGDMYPQRGSLVLEKGVMENPATGKPTSYEELWNDVSPTDASVLVLQIADDKAGVRGRVVRLGGWCQGFVRVGEKIGLERWELVDGGWKSRVKMGDVDLPCEKALNERYEHTVGDEINAGERVWKVIETN